MKKSDLFRRKAIVLNLVPDPPPVPPIPPTPPTPTDPDDTVG